MCSLVINGVPHGGHKGTTTCQLHMRHFKDGETITIEPWRAKAFPLIKDLVVDRSAFDRIIQAGGFVSVNTGGAPDGNAIPVPKDNRRPRDGRGGVHRLRRVRGRVQERLARCSSSRRKFRTSICCRKAKPKKTAACCNMVTQMDEEGFGDCTVTGSCEAVCPKEISLNFIAKMNRDYAVALVKGEPAKPAAAQAKRSLSATGPPPREGTNGASAQAQPFDGLFARTDTP